MLRYNRNDTRNMETRRELHLTTKSYQEMNYVSQGTTVVEKKLLPGSSYSGARRQYCRSQVTPGIKNTRRTVGAAIKLQLPKGIVTVQKEAS